MVKLTNLTAQSLIGRACRNYAEDPIATFENETWTYSEAWRRGGELASALSNAGLKPGERVGIMMSNSLEYLAANFACVRGGFVSVPLNDLLSKNEFQYILTNSDAKAVVVGEELINMLADVESNLSNLDLVLASTDNPPEGMQELSQFRAENDAGAGDTKVGPDDFLFFSYTGGTTGKPKAVRQTHGMLGMNILAHVSDLDIRHHEKILITTPLPHAAGYILLSGMVKGVHFTITQGFDTGEFLDYVERYGITWTFLVPTMIYRLLDNNSLANTDISSLDTIVYGGAPITPDRLVEALDVFGQIFIQLYSQMEMPDIGTILSKEDHKPGAKCIESCGKPATMVDVRIANSNEKADIDPLPIGESGEVLLRSPYTMDGYHKRPEETAQTLVDGWLRTGDIGKQNREGYLYLLDRQSDMLVTGGMNVYTTEVENALIGHPKVKHVAVIGIPHDEWGEAVHAVIVPKSGSEVNAEEIRTYADKHLAAYKKPKTVDTIDKLPMTPYGKTDKNQLKKPYWENQDRSIN